MTKMMDDFVGFLQQYGIVGLAIAVVVGNATKDLVNAVVDDILMPFIGLLLPGEGWRTYTATVAGAELGIGHLIGAMLDFVLIAMVVFLFVKFVLRKEEVKKV